MRARIVQGSTGTAFNRGDTPLTGPLNPIPQHKVPYPRASQPVLLRRRGIGHAPGSSYHHEVAKLKSSNGTGEFVPSANYAGSRGFSTDGTGKTVYHEVWIPITKNNLSANPDSLVDFLANTDNEILMDHALSFLLMAVSQVSINSTKEHARRSSNLKPGYFVASDGSFQPRSEAFVHNMWAPDADHPDGWAELIGALPRDPLPGEPTTVAEKPDIFRINELTHPSRHVGYLVQVLYYDPTLHPNVQMAYTILSNSMLKQVDERTSAELKINGLLFRTNQAFTRQGAVAAPPPAAGSSNSNDGEIDSAPKKSAVAPAGAKNKPAKKKKNNKSKVADPYGTADLSGSEAEEVADDEDLDSEKEAAEAEAIREAVEKRAEQSARAPHDTEIAKRLNERLSKLVKGDAAAALPPAIDEANFSTPANPARKLATKDEREEGEESSDGGSFDPDRPADDAGSGADEEMRDAKDELSSGEESGASKDQEMKDAEEGSGDDGEEGEDEEEKEPAEGFTMDELVDQAEEEFGSLDSEEERERLGEDKAKRPERKARASKSAAPEDEEDEEAKALREKAAKISAEQSQKHREVSAGGNNPFAIEENLQDAACKEQVEKELKMLKELGPAYRAYESARYRVALAHRETLPCLMGRAVMDLTLFSTVVIDPILRAAGSPLCQQHLNGLYDTPANLSVEAYRYWMLDPSTPLHYSKFCSFEVARQVLIRSFPERVGIVCAAPSPQYDYFSYAGPPEDPYYRHPFPWCVASYNPEDLNPEVLAGYRPPGSLSACDAIIDQINAEEAQDKIARSTANRKLAALYEHPRAPHIGSLDEQATSSESGAGEEFKLSENGEKVPHCVTGAQILSHLSKMHQEHVRETAKTGTQDPNEAADKVAMPPPSKRPSKSSRDTSSARTAVEYDNDYRSLRGKLEQESKADVRGFASDAGSSMTSRERGRFGTHAVMHGSKFGSGPSAAAAAVDARGQREGFSSHDPNESARLRAQSDGNQLRWLSQALQAATDEVDRSLIQSAIVRIRALSEEERTVALGELSNPGEKSVYAGVTDCCRRVLAKRDGDGSARGQGTGAAGTAIAGTARHPTNEGATKVLAGHGDAMHRTEAQLNAFKIEGPIDKLAEARNKKYDVLLTCSLKLPMRSNIKTMRDWLNTKCPTWTQDPEMRLPGNAREAQECGIPLNDYLVLRAMNYEREERLRHEWFAEALAVFRGESAAEVCSVLSPTNEELSDSIRSSLMWLNARPDHRVMVRPVITFDTTMTPLAIAFCHDLLEAAEVQPMNEAFGPRYMRAQWNERLTMLRFTEGRMPDLYILHGPPGCGKSMLFNVIKCSAPPNTMLVNHYSSKLALMTPDGRGIDNTCTISHEAPLMWTNGTAADPHHMEQANLLKSTTTEQCIVYKRNTEDPKTGRRRLEKIEVTYHHNQLMATNHYSAPADMRDRVRYGTSMAPVSSVRGVVNAASKAGSGNNNDPQKQRLYKAWQNERWDEVAIVVIIEAMIACKAMPDVNTKVFDAVRMRGDAVLTEWYGQITDSARPYQRAANEARQNVLERVFHVYFRSEASPYITLTREVDPATGATIPHLSMDKPKEFVPRDLPTMISPAMCAGYQEAIPAYFSVLQHDLISFEQWQILNILAAGMGFTDDYMATSYHRFGVQLPDVIGRANQRLEPGRAPITSRRSACSFLRDYYDNFESRVRRLAVNVQLTRASRAGMPRPQFITSAQFLRLVPSAADCVPAPPAFVPASKDDAQHIQKDPELNPTMIIRYFTTQNELVQTVLNDCKGIVTGVDAKVIMSLLLELNNRPAVKAPIHKSVIASQICAGELSFEGPTIVGGSAPNNSTQRLATMTMRNGAPLPIHRRPVPILKMGEDANRRIYVAISTYSLMVKFPEVAYMALTAHEGPNTRVARCVLPIGYVDAPLLMHMWTTRPNPHGTSNAQSSAQFQSVTSETSMKIRAIAVLPGDHRARETNRTIVDQGREVSSQLYDVSAYDSASAANGGKAASGSALANMDLEMREYVQFLVNSHYVPPSSVDQPSADVQNIVDIIASFAPTLISAPGNVEKYIQYMHSRCPELKSAKDDTRNYPEDFVIETIHQNDLALAREEFEKNPEEPIDGEKWRTYMSELFPEDMDSPAAIGDASKARLKGLYDTLVDVMRIETRRSNPVVVGETPPPHHPSYPVVMIAYRSWLRRLNRMEECFDASKRIQALKGNRLESIAELALKEEQYDTITDYLRATAPGAQGTVPLRNGAVVVPAAAGTPRPVGEEEEDSMSVSADPSHQPATPSAGANTAAESEDFERLMTKGARLAAEIPLPDGAIGMSARAVRLRAQRKRKSGKSGRPATTQDAGNGVFDEGDDAGLLGPGQRRRRSNPKGDDLYD